MSSNLFARFIEVIERQSLLISRLIVVVILIILIIGILEGDPFVVYEIYLPVEGEPDEEVSKYLEKFKNEHNKEELAIHWHPSTGTPTAVFGKLAKFDIASEKNAREFLRKNKDLFKFSNDLSDLTLSRCFDSPVGKHFVFEQKFKNTSKDIYIAYGGQVRVSFNQKAEIIAINNTYLPNIDSDSILSKLEQKKAADFAKGVLNVKQRVNLDKMKISIKGRDKPVIYFFNKEIKLSWRFVISTLSNTWEVFIDTENGISLGNPRDVNRYFVTGKGKIFRINAVVATKDSSLRDRNDSDFASSVDAYIIEELKGLEGNGYLDGEYASSKLSNPRVYNPNNEFCYTRSSDGFSETMVYYYIDYTQRYIQSLGFKDINNYQIAYTINSSAEDRSFYDPEEKILNFGTGGVDDAEDAEIIIHEYGHAIQDSQVQGKRQGEAEAIDEGFGDYLAASVGARFSGGFQDDCIGEWDEVYRTSSPPLRNIRNCVRRLDKNKRYNENRREPYGPYEGGEIWASALWEIRSAIGAYKADKVIIQSHFFITPNASFSQGADAIIKASMELSNVYEETSNFTYADIIRIREVLNTQGFKVNL